MFQAIKTQSTTLNMTEFDPALRQYFEDWRNEYLNGLNDLALSSMLKRELTHGFLWGQYLRRFRAAEAFENIRRKVTIADGFEDVFVGYAPSTEKVLPLDAGFEALPAMVNIAAAGNEKEAFQLIVFPGGKNLKNVSVRFSEFKGTCESLPHSAVSATVVGFVAPKIFPVYSIDYMGFYSDPLLAFLDRVDVRKGEAQPFWIRFDIPKTQAAGVYKGQVEIAIDGKNVFAVDVSLRVYAFSVPDKAPLPLAITFWPEYMRKWTMGIPAEKRDSVSAPRQAWKKHKNAWVEMLANYYMSYDSIYDEKIYPGWDTDFEILTRLKKQGRLNLFSLGYFSPAKDNSHERYGMRSTIDAIRKRYDKAKELGLLEHTYIYGCDEEQPGNFARVNRAASILKKEFPDVPLLTTSADPTYGTDGKLSMINWFCPLTFNYNETQAAKARNEGKKVWWYICAGVNFPSSYVETSAHELRLLMGAMTAKFRPDGFLYYSISLWNDLEPVTSDPFTSFNIESFSRFHGDGMWVYPGPDGIPVPSIRLENFRDGLEDYAYVKILEEKLAVADPQSAWSQSARQALKVPEDLVGGVKSGTRDAAKILNWRNRLAEVIEKAP